MAQHDRHQPGALAHVLRHPVDDASGEGRLGGRLDDVASRTDVCEILAALGGSASRAQLLGRGCTRAALKGALDCGLVVLLARGRYALPVAVDPRRSAVRLKGSASHTSAALHWGMAVAKAPQRPHVTVARSRSRLVAKGVELHWSDLAPQECDDHVTSPRRTVLDCARTLPFTEGLAVADSALRDCLVDAEDLRRHAAALRGPGARLARCVVEHADARSANPFESVLRGLAIDAGLRVEPQFVVRSDHVFARVDLADVQRRLVLEADSFAFHGGRIALERDCRRYDELVLLGWRVLRFAWEHVMLEPDWVRGVLARAAELPSVEHAQSLLTA